MLATPGLAAGAGTGFAPRSPWALALTLGVTVLAVGLSVAGGLALDDPRSPGMMLVATVVAASILIVAFVHPAIGYLGLLSSVMLLMVFVVLPPRGVNVVDVLMPPVLFGTFVSWCHAKRPRDREVPPTGARGELTRAQSRFACAVLWLGAVAVLSLIWPVFKYGPQSVIPSFYSLIRAGQGALFYTLGLIWLTTSRRLLNAIDALLVGGILMVAVNAIVMPLANLERAGSIWYVNSPSWPLEGLNEASTASLLLFATLLARHAVRPQARNVVMMIAMFAIMILSQSRSGLVAWLVFGLCILPRVRAGYLVAALLVLGVLLPFIPGEWYGRMARSLALQQGTNETGSILVRVYIWKSAWSAFLTHPILGMGYYSFERLSSHYNDLRIVMAGAHNYFLEIAAGTGLIGLTALGVVLARLFQLGRAVRRVAPPGSLAEQLARYHGPLMVALIAFNLFGTGFLGMQGISQVAVWCALLVRAGHTSLDRTPT